MPQGCRALNSIVAALALTMLAGPAAASASPWVTAPRSAARLVADGAASGTTYRLAALEIRLDPGFKTYWRTPGDAGVPPAFDWSASDNVASVDVNWPAPLRFADPAGFSIGYAGDVALPLTVRPRDPGRPSHLRLTLNYAVCAQLCIPARVSLALPMAGKGDPADDAVLAAARAKVPRRLALGETADGLSILAARGAGGELLVTLAGPAASTVEDVFAEAPGLWVFGKPVLEGGQDGTILARIPIEDRPRAADAPVPVTLTIVAGERSIEVATTLDAMPAAR